MKPQLKAMSETFKDDSPQRSDRTDRSDSSYHTLDVCYVDGITKKDFDVDLVYHLDSKNADLRDLRQLRQSEICISLNFYKITQDFLESDEDLTIICEDDIRFLSKNVVKSFHDYLNNSNLSVSSLSKKERPVLIYGCYIERPTPQLVTKNSAENRFIGSRALYGNPLLIINRAFAEKIVQNFLPIQYPYDQYLRNLVDNAEKEKIKCFRALPMLAYELSSDYYKVFHTKADILHRLNIQRESKVEDQITKETKTINIISESTKLTKFLLSRLSLKCSSKIRQVPKNSIYITMVDALEVVLSENAICCGSGIHDPNKFTNLLKKEDNPLRKPFLIFSVRGPLTRTELLKNGIVCPERYGDPLLLISDIYDSQSTINIAKKDSLKIGVICKDDEKDELIKIINEKIENGWGDLDLKPNRLIQHIFINMDKMSIETAIQLILECDIILSSSLQGIIISHSYGKQVVWISFRRLTIIQKFRFLDYYEGIKYYMSGADPKSLDSESTKPMNLRKNQMVLFKPEDYVQIEIQSEKLRIIKDQIILNNPIFAKIF